MSKVEQINLTEAGYKDYLKQLKDYKSERPQLADEVRRAAADGDIRENAPLDAAREKIEMVNSKIFEIDFLRAVSLTFFTVGIFWNGIGAFFLSRIGSIPTNLLFTFVTSLTSGMSLNLPESNQTIEKDSQRPSYLRLVVGVAKDTDAVLNFLKEKVEPIYEESDGIQLAGAIFDGNNAISWNFWDSKEAMDAAVVKLEAELDSAEEEALFESATAYMGPVYAGKIFVEFTEGSTPS